MANFIKKMAPSFLVGFFAALVAGVTQLPEFLTGAAEDINNAVNKGITTGGDIAQAGGIPFVYVAVTIGIIALVLMLLKKFRG